MSSRHSGRGNKNVQAANSMQRMPERSQQAFGVRDAEHGVVSESKRV